TEYERQTGIAIAYTGAFAAALGKSLLGSAQTEVFAPRVLDLARKLKEAGKMLYFKPLCFTQYVVVTPKGNPAGITSITDLGRSGVRVVLAPQASPPGGDAVKVILKKAGVEEAALKNTVIQGSCVQTIMDDVIDGKGDASIVEMRLTRVERFAGKVEVISIPSEFLPPPPLPFTIGVMKYAKDRDLADHYVDFICSEAGQRFFEQAGFIPAVSEQGKLLVNKLGVHDA
ncbi:MAG TPA: substrate-binding domain-containing protein, partial [Thermodesulfobacteriota bacterium]|nr:substrate-binding domain-containing protein [Thermodesulfobacteriota bacterium]